MPGRARGQRGLSPYFSIICKIENCEIFTNLTVGAGCKLVPEIALRQPELLQGKRIGR